MLLGSTRLTEPDGTRHVRAVDLGHHRVPQVPAARPVSRSGRADEAGVLPRLDVLGTSGAGLRGSAREDARPRTRPGGPWRQPHGPGLHRRSRTIALLPNLRVVVALGAVAMNSFLRAWQVLGHEVGSPKPRFRHAGTWSLPPVTLIASYHPSQRNTQTGLLTEAMFDRIFDAARTRLSTATQVSRPSRIR